MAYPKIPLYSTSKEGFGPCHDYPNINQGFFYIDDKGENKFYWRCWVGMEQNDGGFHSEGSCQQGSELCVDNQSFCAINCQAVKDIFDQTTWDLTYGYDDTKEEGKKWGYYYSYDTGKIIYAKLWQRIYEIFLYIYYYPLPIKADDTERRGRRNPEIWSLIDPVQVNANKSYDNAWENGTLYEKELFIPVVPNFNKVKNNTKYKLVDNYYKIFNTRFDGRKKIDTTSDIFTYDYYIENYNRLQYAEDMNTYSTDLHKWVNWTNYPYLPQKSYEKNLTGYNNLKTFLNNDYNKNTCYRNCVAYYDENSWSEINSGHWGTFRWDGGGNSYSYPYIYDDDLYEPLANDESYVKLKNPNKAELPEYIPYDFANATPLQWYDDVCNHLVYIQHDNFINFITTGIQAGEQDILFELYKEVLKRLDTNVPSGQKAKKTIITQQIISNIQELIKNYKINPDRCRACNSYCNAGGCQAVWQSIGGNPCLYEVQYGDPAQEFKVAVGMYATCSFGDGKYHIIPG